MQTLTLNNRDPITVLDGTGKQMLYLRLSKHHSSPSSIVYFTEDTTLQTFFATIDPTKQYTYVTTYKVLNQCPHHLTLTQLNIHTNDTIIVQKENTTPFVLPPTAIQVRLHTEGVQEDQTAILFKNTTIREFFFTFDYNEDFNYYLDKMWHLNDATYQDFTFEQVGLKEGSTITIEKKDDAPWFTPGKSKDNNSATKVEVITDGWGDLKPARTTTIAWSWGTKKKKRRNGEEGRNTKRAKRAQQIFSV